MTMTAEQLRVIPLEELEWPVSYRYVYQLPWGQTSTTLTVDAPGLQGSIEQSKTLGGILWELGIATAITLGAVLVRYDMLCWRFLAAPLPILDGVRRGLLGGAPAGRGDAAMAVLMTGHPDSMGYYRMPLGGIPASWVVDGQLTLGGRDAIEVWGGMMLMGITGHLTGAPLSWLVPYRGALAPSVANPGGHAFRRVMGVAGMLHTRIAPEVSSGPWP